MDELERNKGELNDTGELDGQEENSGQDELDGLDELDGGDGDDGEDGEDDQADAPAVEGIVEHAKYNITGLVDQFDDQNNIVGQYPIGSVQELPVEVGDAAVADGRAERVE